MNEHTNDQSNIDDKGNSVEVIEEKIGDLNIPAYQAEFDPIEAECVGAFVEDALSEDDALASTDDLVDDESE